MPRESHLYRLKKEVWMWALIWYLFNKDALSALISKLCALWTLPQKASFGRKRCRPLARRKESHWFISSWDCGFFSALGAVIFPSAAAPVLLSSAQSVSTPFTTHSAHDEKISAPPPPSPFKLGVINHTSLFYLCPQCSSSSTWHFLCFRTQPWRGATIQILFLNIFSHCFTTEQQARSCY